MIRAWILYLDSTGTPMFEEREGQGGYDSVNPQDWGLGPKCDILLTLQQAQFINAWVQGKTAKKW